MTHFRSNGKKWLEINVPQMNVSQHPPPSPPKQCWVGCRLLENVTRWSINHVHMAPPTSIVCRVRNKFIGDTVSKHPLLRQVVQHCFGAEVGFEAEHPNIVFWRRGDRLSYGSENGRMDRSVSALKSYKIMHFSQYILSVIVSVSQKV